MFERSSIWALLTYSLNDALTYSKSILFMYYLLKLEIVNSSLAIDSEDKSYFAYFFMPNFKQNELSHVEIGICMKNDWTNHIKLNLLSKYQSIELSIHLIVHKLNMKQHKIND